MKKTFRIAHVSDIHFRRRFPLYQWDHVKEVLRIHAPAGIIATGDFVEHPWPLMLVLARREMLQLGRDLDVPVIAIPGNHDVAFKGFFPIWPLTRLYAAIFCQSNDEWVQAKFPTFKEFYSKSFATRFFWRFGLYAKIALRWCALKLRSARARDALEISGTEIPLKIVGFDSNRSMFLASGRVSPGQINEFGSFAFKLENNSDISGSLLPRVALIHHHLVPIPYTRREASGNESFLVLRNAGTVLKELWNHDFDLVLHGHRHYCSFSRIAFERSPESGRELAVLSAASPTTTEPEAGSNSFHLLDFHANGRIRIRKIGFGTEMTVHNSAEVAEQWFEAISPRAVKVRNYRRTVKLLNHSCERVDREVRIDSVGVATELIRYRGLRVRPGGELRVRHFKTRVDRGSIDHAVFQELNEEGLWSSGSFLSIPKEPGEDPKEVSASVVFNPPLTEGQSASFGIRYQIPNSFAMSHWEISTFPSNQDATDLVQGPVGVKQEAVAMRVRFPVRHMHLVLQLPDSLRSPRPYVVCYSPDNYPELNVDKNGDIQPPAGDPAWVADGDISDYERGFFRQAAEPNTWEWNVDYPLLGYKYEIRWHIEDIREETVDGRKAGETNAYRKILVKYARHAYGKARKEIASGAAVRDILMRRYLEPIYAAVPNAIGEREVFRVCLFAFDPETRRLVAVEEAVKGDARPITDVSDEPFGVPFGEGVAGLTFKRCAGIAYFAPPFGERKGAVASLFREAESRNLKAILGIPLFHPDALEFARGKLEEGRAVTWSDLPSVHQAIGVITLASDSEASGLTAFQEGAGAADLFAEVQTLVWDESRDLLKTISAAVLEMR